MQFWLNVLIAIDQLFNTIAGGEPDCSISAHVGHKANADIKWQWLSDLIDYTFEPIESNHCFKSWLADDDNDDTDNLLATGFVAVVGCLVLWLPILLLQKVPKEPQ